MRGARWQRRSFILRNCELGYAEDAAPHDAALQQAPLKGVSVWGCYALREPAHQGKAHVFAVYSTAAQAASQPSAAPRTTLAMLAADDAATAADWCRAIYAAAGRAGMLLRVGEDSDAATLLCVCCADSAEVSRHLRAGGDDGRVVVSRVGGALERVGLRVGDELTALDGQPIPYLDADRLGRLLATARRPFELTVRRPRAPRRPSGAGGAAPAAPAPAPPARPVVDLLGLDLEPAPAAPAPALPEPAPLLAVPPPAADAPVVAAVRSALDNQAEGKRCAARGDAAGAAAAYRRVVDDLLRAQPLYAASPANQAAVATALPGVDLAALYDEAVAGVRAGERPAPAPVAPVAPAPVVPARPQLRSLASMSRDGHDPFADVELPAAPAPAPPPAPVQQPAWAAPPRARAAGPRARGDAAADAAFGAGAAQGGAVARGRGPRRAGAGAAARGGAAARRAGAAEASVTTTPTRSGTGRARSPSRRHHHRNRNRRRRRRAPPSRRRGPRAWRTRTTPRSRGSCPPRRATPSTSSRRTRTAGRTSSRRTARAGCCPCRTSPRSDEDRDFSLLWSLCVS